MTSVLNNAEARKKPFEMFSSKRCKFDSERSVNASSSNGHTGGRTVWQNNDGSKVEELRSFGEEGKLDSPEEYKDCEVSER